MSPIFPLLFTVFLAGGAFADPPQICAGCHASNGDSLIPEYPKLMGQNKQYLINALKAYQSGERINASMQLFSAPLTDKDIESIAEFYSSQ